MSRKRRTAFPITATGPQINTSVLAYNFKEAVTAFRARFPGYQIDEIEGIAPVGVCEASGELIMPWHDYVLDAEGGYLLREHAESLAENDSAD